MKEKQKLKKVKIDEIIKGTSKATGRSGTSAPTGKRKPGRPRKDTSNSDGSGGGSGITTQGSFNAGGATSAGEPSSAFNGGAFDSSPLQASHGGAEPQALPIEPVYDTTAEARGLLETPFSLAAMVFKIKELMLSEAEGDAVMPSWKPIYDIDIKPKLGEHARHIQFGLAISTILAKKYQLVVEMKAQQEKLKFENDRAEKIRDQQNGSFTPPTIPVQQSVNSFGAGNV